MVIWAVYFLRISVTIFLILSGLFPRWADSKFFNRLQYPSSEFVVFGMCNSGYFWYVKRNGRLRFKLRYADLTRLWTYLHRLVPRIYIFSLMNDSYVWNHCSNPRENVSSSTLASENTRDKSSFPASVSGLSVSFRLTIWSWWNWQIWTGIPSNTLGMPRLPSNTTAVMANPLDSIWCLSTAYASFVSSRIHAHPRFSLSAGARAVSNKSSPMCVASKIHTTGWGVSVLLFRVGAVSRMRLIVFSPRSYVSVRSLTVCRFHTWSVHMLFRNFCFLRLFWNCLLHERHR